MSENEDRIRWAEEHRQNFIRQQEVSRRRHNIAFVLLMLIVATVLAVPFGINLTRSHANAAILVDPVWEPVPLVPEAAVRSGPWVEYDKPPFTGYHVVSGTTIWIDGKEVFLTDGWVELEGDPPLMVEVWAGDSFTENEWHIFHEVPLGE